jgi:proteasome lid subunit RPN8/RPN11
LRDRGETEVGGFGICHSDDLLRIDDVQLVQQNCTQVTVEFDDQSVADFFDRQVDAGFRPEEFARVWIHTHPGTSARPSQTDEDTFARVFGSSDWALMFILAQEGECYARLQFNIGPGNGGSARTGRRSWKTAQILPAFLSIRPIWNRQDGLVASTL